MPKISRVAGLCQAFQIVFIICLKLANIAFKKHTVLLNFIYVLNGK